MNSLVSSFVGRSYEPASASGKSEKNDQVSTHLECLGFEQLVKEATQTKEGRLIMFSSEAMTSLKFSTQKDILHTTVITMPFWFVCHQGYVQKEEAKLGSTVEK